MTTATRDTVAIIADIFFHPANLAGANRLNSVAKALAKHGPVDVYAVDEGAGSATEPLAPGITTHYLRRPRQRKDKLVSRLLLEIRTARRLLAMARTRAASYQSVIVTVPPLMQLLVAAALRRHFRGARYVLDVRDVIWEYFDYRPGLVFRIADRLFRAGARWAVRRFDQVICATPGQAERVRAMGVDNVTVVENGVDGWRLDALSQLPPVRRDDNRLTVAYIGTLGFPQGLETLLLAADRLTRDSVDNLRVRIAGTGAEDDKLRALVAELGINNVEFLGELSWDECLSSVYADADLLYAQLRGSPAYATAIPTKLLEYLASGRPLIYGGHGDAARLLADFAGAEVVEPDAPGALADALRRHASRPLTHFPEHGGQLEARYRRESLASHYADLVVGGITETGA